MHNVVIIPKCGQTNGQEHSGDTYITSYMDLGILGQDDTTWVGIQRADAQHFMMIPIIISCPTEHEEDLVQNGIPKLQSSANTNGRMIRCNLGVKY